MFKVGDKVRLKVIYGDEPRIVLIVVKVKNDTLLAAQHEGRIYNLRPDFLELFPDFP